MIKVLVLGLHGILGGSETYINNLIRCLPRESLVCYFLVVGNNKTPYEDSINEFYNDGENHFFYCPDVKKAMFSGLKWLKDFYDNHSFDLIYLNATSAANALYCKYAIDKLHTPLITHSHFSNGPWLNHMIFRPYTIKHSVFKLACAKPSAVWMFNKEIDDVIYIANGIDTNRFRFDMTIRNEMRNELGLSDNQVIIGHVGRFSIEKNHTFFVNICEKLNEKYKFLCIGDGPCKSDLLRTIKEKGLEERFIILPVDTSIERYYNAMDLFAMPSLYEGLPIVSVEAQCNGLPLILSDTISREADLSSHCRFEELNNVDKWIDAIETMNLNRYDGERCVIDSGFSITDSAKIIDRLIKEAVAVKG